MKNAVLMPSNEPTDLQLISLMKEVIDEAKQKSISTKKKLTEQIMIEIIKAQTRFKSKR